MLSLMMYSNPESNWDLLFRRDFPHPMIISLLQPFSEYL